MTWEEFYTWIARHGWRESFQQDANPFTAYVFRVFSRGQTHATFIDGYDLIPEHVRSELGKEMILRANTARARKKEAMRG